MTLATPPGRLEIVNEEINPGKTARYDKRSNMSSDRVSNNLKQHGIEVNIEEPKNKIFRRQPRI